MLLSMSFTSLKTFPISTKIKRHCTQTPVFIMEPGRISAAKLVTSLSEAVEHSSKASPQLRHWVKYFPRLKKGPDTRTRPLPCLQKAFMMGKMVMSSCSPPKLTMQFLCWSHCNLPTMPSIGIESANDKAMQTVEPEKSSTTQRRNSMSILPHLFRSFDNTKPPVPFDPRWNANRCFFQEEFQS